MIGRAYLEKGRPVTVLVRWRPGAGGPRNVLILRADGTVAVRPFRGLRKPAEPVAPLPAPEVRALLARVWKETP